MYNWCVKRPVARRRHREPPPRNASSSLTRQPGDECPRGMLPPGTVHCLVTGGGLAPDGTRWVRGRRPHLLPLRVLSRLFRGKFLAALTREYTRGRLDLAGACAALADPRAFVHLKQQLYRHDWVVYAKRPFAGAAQVFRYLGRSRTPLARPAGLPQALVVPLIVSP